MLDQYQSEIQKYETAISALQSDLDNLRGVAREIEIGIKRSEKLLQTYTRGKRK